MTPAELRFAHDGRTWTARCNWAAIFFFEKTTGISIARFLAEVSLGDPRLSLCAVYLQAVLRHHHPDIDLETCGEMVSDPQLMHQLFEVASESFPKVKSEGEDPGNGDRATG